MEGAAGIEVVSPRVSGEFFAASLLAEKPSARTTFETPPRRAPAPPWRRGAGFTRFLESISGSRPEGELPEFHFPDFALRARPRRAQTETRNASSGNQERPGTEELRFQIPAAEFQDGNSPAPNRSVSRSAKPNSGSVTLKEFPDAHGPSPDRFETLKKI